MNQIFLQFANNKKTHQQKRTKTLETNITSDRGEEKSNSQNIFINQNNPSSKKYNNLYLLQYQKYFNKKLVIKYNVLPNEYTLMKLDNFITAKYCHSLASFKEQLLFNYDEEFLNRFYTKKETTKKIPLFSEFYKSYLKFFCFPTLAELKLNDLIEDMVEKKAKAFYNENFSEKNEKNSEKKINVVIFTNKIRQDISRKYSLNNLTKTSIKNQTNKSSVSLITIEKIFNELNDDNEKGKEKKTVINNRSISKNKTLINNLNGNINKGLKNSVILHKIREKINKTKDMNNLSNKIKIDNTGGVECDSSGKRKKIKNKISRSIQNQLLENNNQIIYTQKLGTTQRNINTILKINSKPTGLSKNNNNIKNHPPPVPLTILENQIQSQRIPSNSKNNSKNLLTDKIYKIKEIKDKNFINTYTYNINNNINNNKNNVCKNYFNTINNNAHANINLNSINNNNNNTNCTIKNNTLIANMSNNIFGNHNFKKHSGNFQFNNYNSNIFNNIANPNSNNNKNVNTNYYNNYNYNYNYIVNNTISNSNNTSKRTISKKIKVIKKPSLQKINQIQKLKSRNIKNSLSDNSNNLNSIATQLKTDNNNIFKKDNISDYYTMKNKNFNSISVKLGNQKSKPKIKLVKTDNKNILTNNNNNNNKLMLNSNNNNIFINNNPKNLNCVSSKKKNTNYYITSGNKNENNSFSSSLKNLNEKKNENNNNNGRKNRVINSKANNQGSTNSYVLYDSQKFIKNMKNANSRENSKNILKDFKIKISKKVNESPRDMKNVKIIKNYCKKK